MIDKLVSYTDSSATAQKTFSESDYAFEADGINELALIECMAQTAAAMQGAKCLKENSGIGLGYISGINDFELLKKVTHNKTYEITTNVTHKIGSFTLISAEVKSSDDIIARGRLKLYIEE